MRIKKIFSAILDGLMVLLILAFGFGIHWLGSALGLWPVKTITETVTVKQPAEIVYVVQPSPAPVETIIYRDGPAGEKLVSFAKDLPFTQEVVADTFKVSFSGVRHVTMADNKLLVLDEIRGDAVLTYKGRPPPMNEVGPFYSTTNGLGVYYRRHFNRVWVFHPWGEIRVSLTGSSPAELTIGIPIKF